MNNPKLQEKLVDALNDLWADYWSGSDYHEGIRAGIEKAKELVLDRPDLYSIEELFHTATVVRCLNPPTEHEWFKLGRLNGMEKAARAMLNVIEF